MLRHNQSGSHVAALALVVVVLGIIGFAGYKVSQAGDKNNTSTAKAPQTSAPQNISNAADLSQTGKALEASSAQVNSGLDDSGLNDDLNSML